MYMSIPSKKQVSMPRSRFNQAMNTLSTTVLSGGRKMLELVPIIFAKMMSPLIVPMETVSLKMSMNSTRTTPASASGRSRRRKR